MKVDKILLALPFVLSAAVLSTLGAVMVSTGTAQAASGPVQVPVHVPTNTCGNTANVIGLLNPAFGNHC